MGALRERERGGQGGGLGQGEEAGNHMFNMRDHFVRTHLRRGLTEERAGELRRLLLLPKLKLMTTLETSLVGRKEQFEARSEAFLAGMPTEGPFIPGLKAREAARRLDVFLKVFRELSASMTFLTDNYATLRVIVDGDAFLSTEFRWDPGKHRKVRSTCKELEQAHEKHMAKQRAHESRHAEIVALKKGGRFCPSPACGQIVDAKDDFNLNPESNNWLHCNQKHCNFFFCQRCGAKRGPVDAHGLHRHVPGCQFYKKSKKKADVPLRFWSASAIEVKRGKKKAGDVRCADCTKTAMETEPCPAPMALPTSWNEDKDPDPKLKRIRRFLQDLR